MERMERFIRSTSKEAFHHYSSIILQLTTPAKAGKEVDQ
jgi:hypothetical protein